MATVNDLVAAEADYKRLKDAVLEYISEFDNPVPDAVYRRTLRNKLRKLVDAPDEPPPRRR